MNNAVVNVMLRDTKVNVLRSWLTINRPLNFNMSLVNELMYWLMPEIHYPNFYSRRVQANLVKLFAEKASFAYIAYKEWLYGKY